MTSKRCITCKEFFNITDFYKDNRVKDGVKGTCKYCYRRRSKIRREINKEEINQKQKDYYSKNKEHYKERNKSYYEENKVSVIKRTHEWQKNNKERRNENSKNNRLKNLEHHRTKGIIYRQKRRSIERNLPSELTRSQWEDIKNTFDNKCAYCGKVEKLEQEHFIPVTKGGEYTKHNIIPACRSCNSSKLNKDFFEWYPSHEHYSELRENKILSFLNIPKNSKSIN